MNEKRVKVQDLIWKVRIKIDHSLVSSFKLDSVLVFTSSIAFLMAYSASIEQCNLTGGSLRQLAMSEFLILSAYSTFMPVISYVAYELDAIALPHPNVQYYTKSTLKTAFSMVSPDSLSQICSFITSPQAGAPTNPVPTFLLFLSKDPTFLGFSQWSITLSWYKAEIFRVRQDSWFFVILLSILGISLIEIYYWLTE